MGNLQLDTEEVKSYYNALENIWAPDDLWHQYSKRKIEYYLKKNKFSENSYVLNAGSGGNSYGLKCKQQHVDIANEKISHLDLFTVCSIENLPFNNSCFDGIICVGSVINYCDAMKSISELSRVLKKKGILILEFENSYGYEYKKKPVYKCAAEIIQVTFQNKLHTQWIYSHAYIKGLIKQYGFKIKKEYYFHILSSYMLNRKKSEKEASKYTKFDKILRWIPSINKHANNIMLVCEKL